MSDDFTTDPHLTSWVEGANGHSEFPIQNLPFGLFSPAPSIARPRIGVAIGDWILDVFSLFTDSLKSNLPIREVLEAETLTPLLRAPKIRDALRAMISNVLAEAYRPHRANVQPFLHPAEACKLYLPAAIGDYTDFYAGIHHAETVGKLFRPDNPLLPNYKHIPIGYHGRASSIRISGEPVVRPRGQTRAPDAEVPVFGPTRRLDFELEMGIWIGPGNALGDPISITKADSHIGGFCLLNDWSARDFQAWEYQPLGPFLAKNFHTTISPWIVTPEALAPFRIAQNPRAEGDPRPLPYLWDDSDQQTGAYAIELGVSIQTARMREQDIPPFKLSQSHASHMYWTMAQLVTHHASNGCDLRPGDLLGTGTISGPTPEGGGSLLEQSAGGKCAITLPTGETRTFLEDGDEVILSGHAKADGRIPIGFGEARARILPART